MTADPRSLPKTPDGYQAAWSIVENAWATTFATAGALDGELLDSSVDREWSFLETQRHLLFVTDAWITRTVCASVSPYHRLGMPPDHRVGRPDPTVDVSAWGINVFAPASFDEILEARLDRMTAVRELIAGLSVPFITQTCEQNASPGFPPSTAFPVGFCIDVVIGEEWAHHTFAIRDLAVLTR